MAITNTINKARQRGANDQQIISEIIQQNPDKAAQIQQGLQRADASSVLNEIIRQNQVESTAQRAQQGNESFLGNIISPIRQAAIGAGKGLVGTSRGIGTAIQKGLQQTVGRGVSALTGQDPQTMGAPELEPGTPEFQAGTEFLQPQGTAQQVGQFGERMAEFVVPGSRIARGLSGIRGLVGVGARALGEGATALGVSGAQELGERGQIGERTVAEGALGTAFPVAGGVARGVSRFTGRFLKGLAGTLSKTKNEILDTIIERPGEALRSLNEGQEKAAKELAKDIANNIDELEKRTSQRFRNLMQGASEKTIPTNQSVINETTGVVIPSVRNTMEDNFNRFGLSLDDVGKVEIPQKSRFTTKRERNVLQEVVDEINKLGDEATPRQINEVATNISQKKLGAQTGENVNPVIDQLRRSLRDIAEVSDETGSIVSANDFFNARRDLLDTFKSISRIKDKQTRLRGGEPSIERIRNVANSLRQFFAESKPFDRNIINEIEELTGEDILGRAAGQVAGSPVGEAGGSVGLAGGAALLPPQTIGRAAAGFGLAQQRTRRAIDVANQLLPGINLSDAAKASVLSLVSQSDTENQTANTTPSRL